MLPHHIVQMFTGIFLKKNEFYGSFLGSLAYHFVSYVTSAPNVSGLSNIDWYYAPADVSRAKDHIFKHNPDQNIFYFLVVSINYTRLRNLSYLWSHLKNEVYREKMWNDDRLLRSVRSSLSEKGTWATVSHTLRISCCIQNPCIRSDQIGVEKVLPTPTQVYQTSLRNNGIISSFNYSSSKIRPCIPKLHAQFHNSEWKNKRLITINSTYTETKQTFRLSPRLSTIILFRTAVEIPSS